MPKTESSPPDARWPVWLTKEQAAARLGNQLPWSSTCSTAGISSR